MSKIKKKYLISTFLVVSILMVGVLSASLISAQDSSYPPIIEKLASRFGVSEDEVKQVFEEVRDEHHADKYAAWVERLDDLVADGSITEDQRAALLDKYEEIRDLKDDLRDLSFDERKQQMRALHEEFSSWAEGEGIDLSIVKPFGGGFRHGYKTGFMMGAH